MTYKNIQSVDPNQPNLAEQPSYSINFLAGFFFTFVLIGFILGCFLKYISYRKQRAQKVAQILREIET